MNLFYNRTFIISATKESAAVQALAAAQVLHTSINDCAFKGLCPKCKDRSEIVLPNTNRAKGEEKLEKIIHQSGACEEMFPGPLNFIKRFMKIGRKKMEHYSKTWPERHGQEEINFHNKQVGLQVNNCHNIYLTYIKHILTYIDSSCSGILKNITSFL